MGEVANPKDKERGLVVYQSRDGQEIRLSFDTVRRFLVSGRPELTTEEEIMLFMGMAKARGLNPFKKDCYLLKYTEKDPAATVVSIDYFRSRARAQEDCVGWKAGIILVKADGTIEHREGSFMLDEEKLVGGWFKAKPKGWDDFYTWTIPLAPFIKRRGDGAVTQFWRPENQSYMIEKVVESQGLRRVWPDEFQGLYIEEDIQPLDVTPAKEPALRIPQPLPEKEKVDDPKADVSKDVSNSAPGNPVDHQDVEQGTVKEKETQATPAEDAKPKSKIELCLERIASFGAETFPPISELRVYTDGMTVVQMKIVSDAYAGKKRALGI